MSLSDDFVINKCDSLFIEIEKREEEFRELKKELASWKIQLQVNELLNNSNLPIERLFQVRVKVFRTFSELLSVLPEKVTAEELSSQCLREPACDSNIFLIEVFVSRPFYNKLLAKEWLMDFSIAAGSHKTAKSVTLQNLAANTITAVLPFPRRGTNDEIVKVFLTSPSNWRCIELVSIHTDISYKFRSDDTNCKSKGDASVEDAIVKINRIYKEHDDARDKSPSGESLSYTLHCLLDGESFTAAAARNSYASLDLAQIICNEGNRAAKIEINDQRVQLELDPGKKSLRIQAPGEELCQLKRYFTTANASLNGAGGSRKWLKGDFHHIQSVNVLKDARTKLIEALNYNHITVHDLLNVYDVYNRFNDACPL